MVYRPSKQQRVQSNDFSFSYSPSRQTLDRSNEYSRSIHEASLNMDLSTSREGLRSLSMDRAGVCFRLPGPRLLGLAPVSLAFLASLLPTASTPGRTMDSRCCHGTMLSLRAIHAIAHPVGRPRRLPAPALRFILLGVTAAACSRSAFGLAAPVAATAAPATATVTSETTTAATTTATA